MRLAKNLIFTFVMAVLILYGAALLGGVGSVELTVWVMLLIVALVLVFRQSRGRSR